LKWKEGCRILLQLAVIPPLTEKVEEVFDVAIEMKESWDWKNINISDCVFFLAACYASYLAAGEYRSWIAWDEWRHLGLGE